MSEDHSLHTCTAEKPELYQPVRLYFENELESPGQWTGKTWWCRGREVAPTWWQYVEPQATEDAGELHGFRN